MGKAARFQSARFDGLVWGFIAGPGWGDLSEVTHKPDWARAEPGFPGPILWTMAPLEWTVAGSQGSRRMWGSAREPGLWPGEVALPSTPVLSRAQLAAGGFSCLPCCSQWIKHLCQQKLLWWGQPRVDGPDGAPRQVNMKKESASWDKGRDRWLTSHYVCRQGKQRKSCWAQARFAFGCALVPSFCLCLCNCSHSCKPTVLTILYPASSLISPFP